MRRSAVSVFVFIAFLAAVQAQTTSLRRPRITRPIDEANLQTLRRNTYPLARPEFDNGAAPANLPMERMQLVLTHSAEQETALKELLDKQQDKSSPQYHQWLTPQQFGQQFGAADQDIQTVTSWLQSHGFQIGRVSNGRNIIEFSGTAGQVQEAFHTAIHKYVVNGEEHWANAGDPQIPVALSPVVAGVATLHNFFRKPQLIRANQQLDASYQPDARRQYTLSSGGYALAPADYATIYNITPLYQASITGTGTTIAVVARTNIRMSDVNSFRSLFSLSSNPPQIVVNGTNPGDLGGGDEAEAVLDTSWSGAVAPAATVKLVISQSTNTTDGVDLSEAYIIDNNAGDVMTESYGDCEANYTQAEANYYSSLAEQAAAQGITYTVAAGDSGAEGCDDPNSETTANGPLSVNILAATPYTVAVGGTEFNENGNYAAYWNPQNNSALSSAISYIPENAWNESCTAAQCGASNAGIWAGSGGASVFVAKPPWQAGVPGIPNDGARDVPDVSFTSAGHDFYLICLDNSCTPNRRGRMSFSGVSGTSAATPSFAGVMALIVQKTGSRQGQADYVLYSLAAAENLSQCNASNTAGLPAGSCIFNDVTVGNNAVPGESGYGTATASYQTGLGYDLATGLGSVNVTNLVNQWNARSTYSINGQITAGNAGISGVTVSLNNGSQTTQTDASGLFSFTNLTPGGSYTVTPVSSGASFAPPSSSFPSLSGNQTISFTVTEPTYSIGGQITLNGTALSGVTVFLNNSQSTQTDTNGNYSFNVTGGASYTVAPISQSYSFLPVNATFPSLSSNQTGANFSATALPPPSAIRFVPVTPCRIADTRNASGPFGGPFLFAQASRDFVIPNSTCGIPPTAQAYSLNVTVVPRGALGYLTVWPSGEAQPIVSTLNSADGRTKANAAIVPAGANGAISVFATNAADLVLDINGYFVSATNSASLAFYPLTPCRIADTRSGTGLFGSPSLSGREDRTFPITSSSCNVPSTAQAYSLNFTVIPVGALGYLTTWPTGQSQPLVSTLNAPTGVVTANAAIVPAGSNGSIDVLATSATDLVIDINGYFAPPGTGGLSLYNLQSCRVLDTRNSAGAQPFSGTLPVNVTSSPCGVPAGAQAYLFNATVVPAGPLGYLSLWATGAAQPLVSTLNALDGSVSSNMAIVLTSNGSIDAFASNPTYLVLDIFGYFAP